MAVRMIRLPYVTPAQLAAIVSGLRREASHPATPAAASEHAHACNLLADSLARLA